MSTNAASSMVDLFVRPLDVLLFRDGRPFSVGDTLATGLFPPLPTTFYGAFRGALLAHHGARFAAGQTVAEERQLPDDVWAAVGAPKNGTLGDLALTHFSLAHLGTGGLVPLYPLPLDVLRYSPKGRDENAPRLLRAIPRGFGKPAGTAGGVRTSLPGGMLPVLPRHSERHYYEHREGLLAHADFLRYLLGETPEPAVHPDPEPDPRLTDEEQAKRGMLHTDRHARTSVAIGEKRTAEEGALFAVEFAAFRRDVGFALRFDHAPGLPERGLLKLGGESRMASFETMDVAALTAPDGLKEKISKAFTVVLLTPAPFENGWRPDFLRDDLTGVLGGCRVRLVGAAVGRPVNVGGWDLQKKAPKPARPAAPAGSVYFFEAVDAAAPFDAEALLGADCFGASVCADPFHRKQGLGLAVVGAWPPNAEAIP